MSMSVLLGALDEGVGQRRCWVSSSINYTLAPMYVHIYTHTHILKQINCVRYYIIRDSYIITAVSLLFFLIVFQQISVCVCMYVCVLNTFDFYGWYRSADNGGRINYSWKISICSVLNVWDNCLDVGRYIEKWHYLIMFFDILIRIRLIMRVHYLSNELAVETVSV